MKRILFCATSYLLTMMIFCGGCGIDKSRQPVQNIDTAMGTIISQTLYGENADVASAEILQMIGELEQEKLSWRVDTSEIHQINQQAGESEGILLSEALAGILRECLAVSEASAGAFDITIGEVVRLWDIDAWAGKKDTSQYPLPKAEQIRQRLENTGYERITLQGNNLYLPARMQLDLGAVGKGIALDEIKKYFENADGVDCAVISVGGSVLTYGAKPDNTPWKVGVVNPLNTSVNLGYLELKGDWCVSTSGDYERYVEIDGVRYHHIINPITGYPADSGLKGVTVLSKDGLLSDALSTACYVLGQEKGSELVKAFDAEALFVDKDGHVTMTEGMEPYFHLSK